MRWSLHSETFLVRLRVFAATILCVIFSISAVYLCTRGALPRFETNILATLPSVYRNQAVESVARSQAATIGAKIAVLVRDRTDRAAEVVAREVVAKMRASGLFASVEESAALTRLSQLRTFFLRAPFQLVDPPADSSEQDVLRNLLEGSVARAFSPEGLEWLRWASADPLLLFPEYLLRSVLPAHGRIVVRNGFFHIEDADPAAVVIFATVSSDGLAAATQQPITKFFYALTASTGATIMPTGIPLFAEDSAGRMRREISVISTVTMAALGLLFWWVFRAWRAVLLLMGAVGVSCFGAVVVTALLWESWLGTPIHLMTVGFGSSLLGVSSDYAVHYLVTQRSCREPGRSEPLRRILPGLLLAFLTSVVGFLGIALSPFPGLQQVALFSYVGLSLSLLLVVALFPSLSGAAQFDNRVARMVSCTGKVVTRKTRLGVFGLLLVPVAYGVTQLEVVDDIRALDTPSEQLVRNQREGAALLNMGEGGAILIVQGESSEETLQREEEAREILDELVRAGRLEGYHAVSKVIPSQKRQRERYLRFAQLLRASPQQIATYSADLHLPPASLDTVRALTSGASPQPLSLAECLESAACDAVRDLVVTTPGGAVATVVPLLLRAGTRVVDIFESAGFIDTVGSEGRAVGAWDLKVHGVSVVSQADAISRALQLYRQSATRATAVFYGVVFLLLSLRYGVWGAGRAFMPPVFGGLAALGALGIAGVPLNVFAVFALMVLLGVSVDYAIFFAEEEDERDGAGFSVLLSASTTAISFGLLAWSSSPALRGFGVVLAVGVVVAALLAPFVRRNGRAGGVTDA